MNGGVHYRPTFCSPGSAFRLHVSYKLIENVAKNFTLLTIFKADPVDHSINAHSIFADIELSYNAKKKQVVAAAQVCSTSEESVPQHFPKRWPK